MGHSAEGIEHKVERPEIANGTEHRAEGIGRRGRKSPLLKHRRTGKSEIVSRESETAESGWKMEAGPSATRPEDRR
jgi:hypothetical protein